MWLRRKQYIISFYSLGQLGSFQNINSSFNEKTYLQGEYSEKEKLLCHRFPDAWNEAPFGPKFICDSLVFCSFYFALLFFSSSPNIWGHLICHLSVLLSLIPSCRLHTWPDTTENTVNDLFCSTCIICKGCTKRDYIKILIQVFWCKYKH